MIYTHLKCSNKFKLRCYAMLPHCRATLRLPPQTPMLLLGSAGARRAPYERLPVRCCRKRRRLTDHTSPASVDAVFHSRHRTAASRTNGQAGGLRFLFLSAQEKDMFLSFAKEKICAFLTEEKSTKRLTETPSRTLMLLLGSAYPRLPTDGTAHLRALSVIRRAGSTCGWGVRARRRKARAV